MGLRRTRIEKIYPILRLDDGDSNVRSGNLPLHRYFPALSLTFVCRGNLFHNKNWLDYLNKSEDKQKGEGRCCFIKQNPKGVWNPNFCEDFINFCVMSDSFVQTSDTLMTLCVIKSHFITLHFKLQKLES